MKFLKVGRVAIITRGRYAGKKVRKLPNLCHHRLLDEKERDDCELDDTPNTK